MYGERHKPVTRKGTSVDMQADEGYGGQMIPGYAGAYQNRKTKVIGKKAKPRSVAAPSPGYKSANESFTSPQPFPKKRK